MILYDYILIIAWGLLTLYGFVKGSIHMIGLLIGSVFGLLAAWYFKSFFTEIWWGQMITFYLVYAIITRLIGFVFELFDATYNIFSFLPFVSLINKVIGSAIGFLIFGILLYFCIVLFRMLGMDYLLQDMQSYQMIVNLMSGLI